MQLKKILLCALLVFPRLLFAQNYEKEFIRNFAWEVKQIDEFIERFNDDSTLIKQYNSKYSPTNQLTREKLIRSLFNAQQTDWNFKEISQFITQVNTKDHAEFLDFYGEKWYAKIFCSITCNGIPEKVMLKLKIQKQANGGCKWVIFDVDTSFLEQNKTPTKKSMLVQPVLPIPVNNKTFLNPESHTIDFLNIDLVTKNSKDLSNFLAPSDRYSDAFCLFINECLDNQLKILKVNSITYTFLQIKGWDIEIQQFNRQTKNCGWLITKLIKSPT